MRLLILLCLIIGCSHQGPSGSPKSGKTVYSYTDISSNYRLVRESKDIKQRVISRTQLLSNDQSNDRVLEKNIVVSRLGSIKGKKSRVITLRPEASEFTVWLEGKKYTSKMALNPKNRSMGLSLSSPDKRWRGNSEVPFPKGQYFCFYSQIPECLYHNFILQRAYQSKNRKIDFFVIWEGFPFIQDQLSNVGKDLFAPASIKFDGEVGRNFRYIVEVEGQVIIYLFSNSYDFLKMSWIVQGITVVPPGEEVTSDD